MPRKNEWTDEEEDILRVTVGIEGKSYRETAELLPGRTERSVANRCCALKIFQAKKIVVSTHAQRNVDLGRVVNRRCPCGNIFLSSRLKEYTCGHCNAETSR